MKTLMEFLLEYKDRNPNVKNVVIVETDMNNRTYVCGSIPYAIDNLLNRANYLLGRKVSIATSEDDNLYVYVCNKKEKEG